MPTPAFTLSLAPRITLVERADGGALLRGPRRGDAIPPASEGARIAVRRLQAGGATEDQIVDEVRARLGDRDLARLFYHLARWRQLGFLCDTARLRGGPLATLVPTGAPRPASLAAPDPARRYALSRFALVRRDGRELVVESPLATARIVLHAPEAAALVHAFAEPRSLDELEAHGQGVDRGACEALVRLLLGARALTPLRDDGETEEDADPALVPWAFHDLLFHARRRMGRHDGPSGKTYPGRSRSAAPPPLALREPGPRRALAAPDLAALEASDLPFTRVLEARRSIRAHGARPITARELGELLFRAARVRARADPAPLRDYAHTSRPYPGAGACYELELYVVANTCEGLPRGLYHYDPEAHDLAEISGWTTEVEALLDDAHDASTKQGRPQVLLVLAARFERVSWAYDAIAYALVLEDVGALYQTVYLVATAMGLAACALGNGDSDLFARAAGTDYYRETSVGELMLGTPSEAG
jgi:SagB-type dehydrogenase family enzyme